MSKINKQSIKTHLRSCVKIKDKKAYGDKNQEELINELKDLKERLYIYVVTGKLFEGRADPFIAFSSFEEAKKFCDLNNPPVTTSNRYDPMFNIMEIPFKQ